MRISNIARSSLRRLLPPGRDIGLEFHRAIFAGLLVMIVLGLAMNVALQYVWVGLDIQEMRCLPWRLYVITARAADAAPRLGSLVEFRPGAQMGEAFAEHRVVKIVAALAGDRVRVTAGQVFVNDRGIEAHLRAIAGLTVKQVGLHPTTLAKLGRAASDFEREQVVPEGHVLMLATEPRSYDGRYWGFLPARRITGDAHPVF